MDNNNERVLLRVKKLIALANDHAATEGERENALRMAHATLAKYNLTMAQVNEAGVTRIIETMLAEQEWSISVCNGIAELFFCFHYYQRYRAAAGAPWAIKHSFIGQPANTTTAQLMSRYVIDSITKESEQYRDAGARASFCTGATRAVVKRCLDIIKAGKITGTDEPSEAAGTAVVLADYYRSEKDRNREWMHKASINLKAGSAIYNASDRAAYGAGKEFGNGISLNAQVAGNGENVRLLK